MQTRVGKQGKPPPPVLDEFPDGAAPP